MAAEAPKVSVVQKGVDTKEAPFVAGFGFDTLIKNTDDATIKSKLEEHKGKFKDRIAKLNKQLTGEHTDNASWYEDTLDQDEYDNAVAHLDQKLEEMDAQFNRDLSYAWENGRLAKPGTVDLALGNLDFALKMLVEHELDDVIDAADSTDGNSAAFARKMEPPAAESQDVKVAEAEESAGEMGDHLAEGGKYLKDPQAYRREQMRRAMGGQ